MGAGASTLAKSPDDDGGDDDDAPVPKAMSLLTPRTRADLAKLPGYAQTELAEKARLLQLPDAATLEAMRQRAASDEISQRLSEAAQAHALARYHKTDELRKLLMPDPERGDKPPIRLVSARWLLNTFKGTSVPARLEHRQALERAYGDAPFVHGAKLERVLAEMVEVDVSRKQDGSEMRLAYHGVKYSFAHVELNFGYPMELNFPSATAMSHMCAAARPRAHARHRAATPPRRRRR